MRGDPNDYVGLLVAIGAAAASLWYAAKALREGRAIRDTPTSRVRSAAQGYVELSGKSRLPPNLDIRGPLTRQPCIWWSYTIEEASSGGRSRDWRKIESGTSDSPFLLDDGTGTCMIYPVGAQVYGVKRTVWYGSSPRPGVRLPTGSSWIERGFDLLVRGDYRYTEKRLAVDADIFAIGAFRTAGGVTAFDADAAFNRLIGEWKRDQAGLLQRFDANHDGVIDQTEWEAARAAARAQVQNESLRRPAGPAINVLAKPTDERPFLLAQGDVTKLERRYRWQFAFCSIGFVLLSALITRLIQDL